MINEQKLQLVKRLGIGAAVVLLLLTGLLVGLRLGKPAKVSQKQVPAKVISTSNLSTGNVTHFLTEYYTKKELSENRNRYKNLMTDEMYREAVVTENQPVNQDYKGYIINQVYQKATIYLDETDLTALCVVHYTNTQRSSLQSSVGELKDQENTDTILLSYTKQGKKFLVNNIQNVAFSEPLDADNQNAYPESTIASSYSNALGTKPNDRVAITGGGVTSSSTTEKGGNP